MPDVQQRKRAMIMTSQPSGWMTTKPTVAGWYWLRDLSAREATAHLMIVYVYKGQRGLWVERDGSYGDIVAVEKCPGEFLGPLTPAQYIEWASREGR